ncbi:hypothetical protein E2C01_078060 [Portunus trituberculatus]|uniref:Uncharacterized protein n=1 Tax=Portunus trituberculatus TaxID=210409 RepID=A0A5B7ID05_PORTR|nr:hypothetical protein [Portunus trituberculatus]
MAPLGLTGERFISHQATRMGFNNPVNEIHCLSPLNGLRLVFPLNGSHPRIRSIYCAFPTECVTGLLLAPATTLSA